MAEISKFTLPDGNTYDIKDAEARKLIGELESYTDYLGVSTTELTDGATTNPITVDSKSVTAVKGNIANYGKKEFIFNGTAWQEFGDMSGLKALAFKDSASGTFKPSGTVSKPTFTGTEGNVSVSGTPAGTISKGTGAANFTPEGTVSKPTFTGSSTTSTGKFTPAGNVTISKGTGTANYTPEGTVSNVALNTTTVNSITAVGTLPSCTLPTYTVSGETLTITAGSFSAGTLPTKGSNTTVATGVKTQPSFTGKGVELKGAFTGTEGNISVSGTPSGSVSQPTFTGTGAELKFTGAAMESTGKFTPAGSVSQPTFTGTDGNVTVS